MESPEPDHYYSPERVKQLLRLYPYLSDSKPPQDEGLEILAHKMFGPNGWRLEAACKRADIASAIQWLEGRDWRAAYIVRAKFCVGLTYRDAGSYLERQGVSVSDETIRRWCLDGVELMAGFLGWRAER